MRSGVVIGLVPIEECDYAVLVKAMIRLDADLNRDAQEDAVLAAIEAELERRGPDGERG